MSIEERGKALEEAFFAKKNKELLEQVKAELDVKTKREELKNATGISDDDVLDKLSQIGLNSETIMAVSIAPLVLVAWADGKVSDKEREAVLTSADQAGVKSDSAAGKVLSSWLDEKPSDQLAVTWKDYMKAILEKLPAGERVRLGEQIMERCNAVAEATGGFLGLGSISVQEKAVLDMLKAALD